MGVDAGRAVAMDVDVASAQAKVLELVARGGALPVILDAIVAMVETQASGMLCSILLFDPERNSLSCGAARGLPAAYLAALEGAVIGPNAGSCGAAAFHRKRVITEDIATDLAWIRYRDLALPHGLRACWSTPIFAPAGDLLGTFAMYYRERRTPAPPEIAWVEVATHLAEIAIVRDRVEQSLRRTEVRLRCLNELGEVMRAETDPDRILPTVLRRLCEHLHASRCVWGEVHADGDHVTMPHEHVDGVASIIGDARLSDFGPRLATQLREATGPIVVHDVRELGDAAGAAALEATGIRAHVGCALVRHGQLRAVLGVHQSTPRRWTADEVALIQEVAERSWSTIEQRTAELRLRKSEAMLRIASRAARLGGWSLALPELRATWSDEVCAIHGVQPGTAPSLAQAIAFYAPEYRETIARDIAACARDGTPFDREMQIITAGGKRLWVRAIGQPERNAEGEVTRVVGAFQDVSERHALEAQFRQAQKMEAIGQLAGGIAHDFNNLLTVILTYAQFVLDDLPATVPLRAEVEEIMLAGGRAAALTRQLLAFSRRQVLQPRVLDLNQIVTGVEKMLRRLLGDAIQLSLHTAASPCRVLADPGQIEQVIVNLSVNARDAMAGGGRLDLETALVELDAATAGDLRPGSYVVLGVTDSGTGMDAATQARIFEPFFTTKDKDKGTGLGLSTVYGIVTQTGGDIRVTSAPGEGTTFRIYLPRVDLAVGEPAVTPPTRSLRGIETILVVDDEDTVRAAVRSVLHRGGYRVLEAQNAGEALLICEQATTPIHLLVTDLVMPRMSGRQLAERLAPLQPAMAVLYMSGYTDDEFADQGAHEVGLAFLPKPFTPDTLLQKVRDVLDER